MVKQSEAHLNQLFSALADPTRRAILRRLAQGESNVSDLARPFRVTLPAISKHLRVLERAGLVERRIEGRVHRCRLQPRPLKDASDWLAEYRQYWERQFDALGAFLERSEEA